MTAALVNFLLVFLVSASAMLLGLLWRQGTLRGLFSAHLACLIALGASLLIATNTASPEWRQLAGRGQWVITAALLLLAVRSAAAFRNFPERGPVTSLERAAGAILFVVAGLAAAPAPLLFDAGRHHLSTSATFAAMILIGVTALFVNQRLDGPAGAVRPASLTAMAVEVRRWVIPGGATALLLLTAWHLLPGAPVALGAGALLAAVLPLGVAVRFHLLGQGDYHTYFLPQLVVSGLFIFVFYFSLPQFMGLGEILLGISFFILITYIGFYVQITLSRSFRNLQFGYDEALEERLELFSRDVGQMLNFEQLWPAVAAFLRSTFDISRIAIATADIAAPSGRIVHREGFTATELQELLDGDHPRFGALLHAEPYLISLYDPPADAPLREALDTARVDLVVRLAVPGRVLGLILMGGKSPYAPVLPQHRRVLKLLAVHVSTAIEKIQSIERLLQSQKLAGLGMVASQIAHDFRSFIGITRASLASNERLDRQAAYMDKMVQDLLEYARPPEFKRMRVDINQLIDTALDVLEIPADIEVDRRYGRDLPRVDVDMHQLRRVFSNVIANGIRAMVAGEGLAGNRLTLHTRYLSSAANGNLSGWVEIDIEDQGLGIPDEFQARIFDPFFTTFKHEGGNGLGLAISKQILERHNGEVDVFSESGKGTCFRLRLPVIAEIPVEEAHGQSE